MRRALILAGLCAVVIVPARASASPVSHESAVFVVMPESDAGGFGDVGAVAVGVHPPFREATPFIEAVAAGPTIDEPDGVPGGLAVVLGGEIRIAPLPAGEGPLTSLGRALIARGATEVTFDEALVQPSGPSVTVFTFASSKDADAVLTGAPARSGPWIVVGIEVERIATIRYVDSPSGLWIGAETRRPGLITPVDVTTALLRAFRTGRGPTIDPKPDALAALDALRARLERDAGVLRPVTMLTVSLGLAGLFFALLALWARRPRLAAAFARAAACVPAGYVVALVVPDGRWQVRATALVAASAFGLSFGARDTRRFAGWTFLLTAASIAVLTILAAARPGAEPALSLWGNPLESGRYFGLRNHLVAFLTGGLVAGSALLGMPWWLLLGAGAAATAMLGAASLGANFLGVLTLSFGVLVAVFALAAARARWFHAAIAAAAASGATIAALAADTAGVSHGGRAFAEVRAGGWDAGVALFRGRAALNRAEIEDIGWAAWIALVLLTLVLVWLFVWTVRSARATVGVRAAVAGTAAAALAALVTEDSGFFSAGIVGLFAATAWLASRADAVTPPAAAPPVAHEPPALA